MRRTDYYSISKLFTFLVISSTFILSAIGQEKSTNGDWSEVIPLDVIPVAVSNLPDGKLIVWSAKFRESFNINDDGVTYTEIYDPFIGKIGAGQGESTTNLQHDMFCPGINNLPDGRVLSAGGTSSFKTSIYDYNTGLWTAADEMNVRRAYQGNVTLPNGDVFTWGGSWSEVPPYPTSSDKVAEVWDITTDSWTELTGLTGDILWNANDAALEIPAEGVYRLDNHLWLWVASNGGLFHAGPSEDMHWIDLTSAGSVSAPYSRGGDTYSMKGTTVMFDIDKILKVGGSRSYGNNTPAKENAFVIDINVPFNTAPNVQQTPDMEFERTMHNSTVLPTGQVLVTGGLDHAEVFSDNGAQLYAELFTPNAAGTNGTWETLSYMATPRTYHSVSILLTDGTVFSGGGGLSEIAFNHFNGEIFYPPYLFETDGSYKERPYINAPATSNYSTSINVSGSNGIDEMALVRFSAATHSTNNEQRRIPVTYTEDTPGNYTVAIPDENLLPPGYYMLFAMDNGVPSLAETIQIAQPVFTGANPCDGGVNIVPEVTVNGTPNIGDDFYLLAGGENITIAANGGTITNITGPDGSITNAATVTLTGLDETTEGWYTLKTATGCFTRVKLVINTPETPICAPGDLTNLALNKPAKQSSTKGSDTASKANDGILNNSDNYNHTQDTDRSPWWEVNLQSELYIEEVIINNRTNVSEAVQNRLRDFYVLTSKTAFPENGDITQMIKNTNYSVTYYGGAVSTQTTIKINENGQFLRIHFPESGGNRILHVQEIQVLGCDDTAPDPCDGTQDVSITPLGDLLTTDAIQILSATPLGGTWSGNSTDGNFDPSIGEGTYSITYTVDFGNGCTKQDTIDITVNEPSTGGGDCTTTTNLALSATASQSSTYGFGDPALAIDGNTTGTSPWSADLQHTNGEDQPWWQIDLGQEKYVQEVTIYNRTDKLQARLNNFYILLSKTPFEPSDALQDLLDDPTVEKQFFQGNASLQENFTLETNARYLRVQMQGGNETLHMAEVIVMGCDDSAPDPCDGTQNVSITPLGDLLTTDAIQILSATPLGGTWSGNSTDGNFDPSIGEGTYSITYTVDFGNGCTKQDTIDITVNEPSTGGGDCTTTTNLALSATASQSSTYGFGDPALAIDGNTTGTSPWSADLQHTNGEDQPWWQIDLGQEKYVQEVTIYNRTDKLQARLNNFYILLSKTPFEPSDALQDLLDDPTVEKQFFQGNASLQENFTLETNARYLRVQMQGGNETLHMAEVIVMGCDDSAPDPCDGTQDVSITPLGDLLTTDAIQILSATPLGGTWSGNSTDGNFDPSIGEGTYSITYTVDFGNGCTKQDTIDITVNEPSTGGGDCTTTTNLALSATASQSSTYGFGDPALAIDGNTTGTSPWSADLQHTNGEDQPWWQIDLGQEKYVQEVTIYNRTDKLQARLNNFYILLSKTPFEPSDALQDLLDDPTVEKQFFQGNASLQENFTLETNARYLRVQMQGGNETLHMAEVIVMGCDDTTTNLRANLGLSMESKLIDELLIYPIPSKEDFNFVLPKMFNGSGELFITDIQGKIIKKISIHSSYRENQRFKLKNIPNGVYNVILKNKNQSWEKKILVRQ